jgi:transcription elongation GreA/GreB family factor/transcription elongation factor GreA-like protein
MTEPTSEIQVELTRMRKLVTKKRFDDVEAIWMEAIARDDADIDGLLSVLEALARRDKSDVADSLFWFMLSECAERDGPEQGVAITRRAATFVSGSSALRDEVASIYHRAHPSIDGVRTMAEMTVLHAPVPFALAVKRFDKLLKLAPGTCVIDTQHNKLGQVTRIDGDTRTVEAAFDDRPRTYDRLGVDKLEPLAEDDFRSRIVKDRESLDAMAWEQPAELARTLLRTYGPRLEFRQMKEHIKEIVPAKSWAKWWKAARVECKRDPMIEMSDDTSPWLFVRKQAVAYEAELKRAFDTASSAEEKLVTVLGYLAECGDAPPDEEVSRHFGAQLAGSADAWRDSQPVMALGAMAVVGELHKRIADIAAPDAHAMEALLFSVGDLAALLHPVVADSLARAILEMLRSDLTSAWHEVWAALMPGSSSTVCAWIADELAAGGHVEDLRSAVGTIAARPEHYPTATIWLWKSVSAGKHADVTSDINRLDAAVKLLTAASGLDRGGTFDKEQQQRLLPQIRSAISAKNFEGMRAAVDEADAHGAARMHRAVVRNFILGDQMQTRITDLIGRTHPDLFVKTVLPWEDEDTLYTSAEGLKKHQAEFTELVNVKIAANAKAIGEAAARGDLSENAEFTAALEERNLLTEKAARMEADLNKTKVITPQMAEGDVVTVGSTITARRVDSGAIETMTFLGPWDSAPERGVYSYRAAMAMAFMGKTAGDRVELAVDDGTRVWDIIEIRPADLDSA